MSQVLNLVPCGLAAMLGAGLFVGLAPAASAAGVWLLAALVLAALLAIACGLSTSSGAGPVRRGVGILGRIAGASAIAGVFGGYVAPGRPVLAAVGLVAVVTALIALGWRPPAALVRAALVVVLAVLAVFVAACLAIEPPGQVVAPPGGSPGSDDPAGLPVATVLLFFCFLGFDNAAVGRRRRLAVLVTIGTALVIYLAVAGAALRQLGGTRLALSPAPLRDALAAADASGIEPVLVLGAGLATLLALVGVLAEIRDGTGPLIGPLAALAAAAGSVLLAPATAIAVAAGLMLGHYALAAGARVTSSTGLGRTRPR